MSVQAISWALTQTELSSGAKFLLTILGNYASAEGLCCPGIERLAADSNLDERTVRRHLTWMEEHHFIERDRRYRNGHRTSDQFWLMLPGVAPADDKTVSGQFVPSLPGKNDPTSKRNRQIEPSDLITKSAREKESTKKKCKTSLPENFPSSKEHDWALRHWEARKRPDLNPIEQGEAFRDHHLKTGGRFVDWEAAWRQWTRRAVEYTRQPFGVPGAAGGAANGGSGIPHRSWLDERTEEAIRRVRAREAETG